MCAGQDAAVSDLCFTQEWLMDESVWLRSQMVTQNTALLHGMEQWVLHAAVASLQDQALHAAPDGL